MLNNTFAFVLTSIICVIWLRGVDYFAHKGIISSRLSRKIIHIGTGPIFILCWLLFEDNPMARYLAAVIPLLISVQFALIGMGVIQDKASVDAMSRSGDRREILKGPLFYGIVFVILTIVFWKENPVGMIALLMLCGGDGMADIVGGKFGRIRIPWAKYKSLIGSISVFVFGFFFSILVIGIYSISNVSFQPFSAHLAPITIIGLIVMMIESLPLKDLDNITVPLAAVLTGMAFYI